MDSQHSHGPKPESSTKEYLKFAVVIAGIFVLSILIPYLSNELNLYNWMRWFMGIFFIVFASFKFVGYKMFALMFSGYDLIAKKLKLYSYTYPFIELILGLLYLFNLVPVARDVFTLIVMLVGGVGVAYEVKNRNGIQCACLGGVIKLPLSTTSLVEDFGMAAMAAIMLLSTLI